MLDIFIFLYLPHVELSMVPRIDYKSLLAGSC